jgi:hypothetical protein
MALACNIDAQGKAVRLRIGLVGLALAVMVALVAALLVPSPYMWAAAALMAIGSGFSIFEARAGWCALRALGFRTRV